MYPSDYGYASPTNICGSTKLIDYKTSCRNINWLYKNFSQWTISPGSPSSYAAFIVFGSSNVGNNNVDNLFTYYGYGTRPTVYLKSDISFVTGTTGSETNKYQIVQ